MIATTFAAAQAIALPGDVAANVQEHLRFISAAHRANVQLLVFPELSLTGYELPLLQHCLLHPDDAVLAPIRQQVQHTGMTVVLGAPVGAAAPAGSAATSDLPAIGAITFFPNGSHAVYRKFHLHPGEERYASPGTSGYALCSVGGETLGQAICADISHATHPAQAAAAGATLYVAGVLESPAGYLNDSAAMQRYTQEHGMGTLMANHGGPSGGYVSAGKSAFWSPQGDCVVAAPGTGSWLVMATKRAPTGTGSPTWSGALLPL